MPELTEKQHCSDSTPPWFVGHWREWHRGHRCEFDDGKSRSGAAITEVLQHAANKTTGHLTDAELRFLQARTTSGDELLVRALDELKTRRVGCALDVRLLDIQPHPEQATNNPDCWAVRFEVSHGSTRRAFWRWHTSRVERPEQQTRIEPGHEEVLARFWADTFAELHGFSFDQEDL